jgi:SH3 domain protein
MPRRLASLAALVFLAASAVAGGAAARAWVKGDVLLNVRTGPGSDHRPVGAITTGDPVEILEQSDGWTRISSEATGEGWIPSGFLQDDPPAVVKLERAVSEAAALRQRVEALTAEAEGLRAAQEQAATAVEEQAQEIARLSTENQALQAEVIWPVMLTGASILLTGGLVGAWARGAGRRVGPRVRL